MATISINYATEQDFLDTSIDTEELRAKKSVSARLLQKVLGDDEISTVGYVKRSGDTMTGNLSLTGIDPVQPKHAATKGYVDTNFLSLTGGTLTGSLIFEGTTADAYETTLIVTDPTVDRTIYLPNVDGTIITTGNLNDITNAGVFAGSIILQQIVQLLFKI